MAVSKAPAAQASEEVSEREYQDQVHNTAMVGATDREILEYGFNDEGRPDDDGDTPSEEDEVFGNEDTSPEVIGEVVGDEIVDDAEEEAGGDAEDGDGEEAETDEGEAGDGEQTEKPPRDKRGQFREREPAIPPGRLREQTQRATAAEERAQALERQVAEMNGRIAELSARTNATPPRQAEAPPPKPEPDMFSEYPEWLKWNHEQQVEIARREAQQAFTQGFTQFQQQQQAREAQRVDDSLATAAKGERAFEFGAAYNALTSLDPRNPQSRQTVGRIYNAADPAAALFDWWEQNGGPEYRERVYDQVAPRVQQRNGNGARQPQQGQQQQPRQVFRPAQRLPSLNSATGSNSQRVSDPEMLDGSDRSTFNYGTRR